MKTIRWGIIGVGDVTEVKSGPGFQLAENSELVAVMRRNGDKARDFAERHGVPRWYDDGEALINDPDVDAVCIATPPHVHREYTLQVAAAGKPVYVEKPMALSHAECQAMIGACESAEVPLFVAFYRRALPRFLKVKEIVDSGRIGEPQSVNIRYYAHPPTFENGEIPWRLLPEISGGGRFIDLAVHTLDFLDYVLGPIQSAQGITASRDDRYPAEDHVTATLKFASGVTGVADYCFTAGFHMDETQIVGTKGIVAFSSFNENPVTVTDESGVEEFAITNPKHIQRPLIQSIVDELNGKGACPSTGVSGARTTRVTDMILGQG